MPTLELHGFVSPGYIVSFGNDYLAKSEFEPSSGQIGSFEFAEAGLNATTQLTDRLRAGIQFFVRDLGSTGNYNARFDWFYLDYRFADWFGIRAGRTKVPFGLYNEVNDIDAARVPVLLPQSVYPVENRDFILAQTGAEVYGYVSLGGAGALDYRLYGGTIFVPTNDDLARPVRVRRISVPYLFGGRLMYETPVEGLRVGASGQVLRLDFDLVAAASTPGAAPAQGTLEIPAVVWVASIEYAANALSLAAEYSLWHLKARSSDELLYRSVPDWLVSERFYVMGAYRVNEWFQPGAYYSLYIPDWHAISGLEAQQHDWAVTLRFDINEHWLVKLEGHVMYGSAVLGGSFAPARAPNDFAKTWGVVLLKTTAYF